MERKSEIRALAFACACWDEGCSGDTVGNPDMESRTPSNQLLLAEVVDMTALLRLLK